MKLFKSCLIAISISIPSYCFSQNSIDNNQIGGIKIGMGITEMKKIYPTYKFELFEPDGNGVGDWRMMESNVSTLDIYKPNTKTNSFSIILDKKKVSVIDCQDKNYKTKESIAVGASLGDLMKVYPDLEISIIGSFDKITQREGVVITAMTKAYYNIQFQIASTAELDKMDADKIDKAKLPNNLKVHKITLLSTEVAKSQWDFLQSRNNASDNIGENSNNRNSSVTENKNAINSILLYDGAITLKLGDKVLIKYSNLNEYNLISNFKYVFSDIDFNNPEQVSKLRATFKSIFSIERIFQIKGSSTVYAELSNPIYDRPLYANLSSAIYNKEMEVLNSSIIGDFTIYKFFLKKKNQVSNQTAAEYYSTFEPFLTTDNEFDSRKLLLYGQKICDSIIKTPLETNQLLYPTSIQLDKYNFDKKGFITKNISNILQYEMIKGNPSVIFTNISKGMIVPMDEIKAEEITDKYFAGSNEERKIYCIYTFDFIQQSTSVVKKINGILNYLSTTPTPTPFSTQENTIIQAKVKKIDFYLDGEYKVKLATINLD